MIRLYVSIFAVSSLLINYASCAVADAENNPPPEMVQLASNTVICKFKDSTLPDNVPAFVSDIVQQNGGSVRHTFNTVIKGFSAYMSQNAAEALQVHNPNIDYCVANALMTIGGTKVKQGGKGGAGGKPGQAIPQIVPAGVTRVGGPVDGTGLTAWILDSGIDINHPDLNVDTIRGFDAVSSVAKGKTTFDDVHGHGTHVAGILAAIDNDIDVVGVAAGATVVPVRVLSASSWGYADDAIAGMNYVAENASMNDVANMSVWGWNHNRALHDAAYNLADRLTLVTIAGNDSLDINDQPTEPGHVEHRHLITVSAVDHNDVFTGFSNWAYAGDWNNCSVNYPNDPYPCATVDYSAPGQNVLSLQPGGGVAEWNGTSMAAPHVAAIRLLKQNRNITLGSDGTAIGDPDSYPDPIVHY
jgi:subtilisin family serine protease